jgi:uncharacterized protein (TIGR02246 family)
MMKNPILLLVLTIMTILATGPAATGEPIAGKEAPAAAAEKQQTAEEKAVRATAEEFTAAFNRGDAKAIAALWTPDCEYIEESGRETRGRDAIEKEYAELFRAKPGVQMETSVSSVKVLGPAVALEEGTTILKSPKGKFISRGYYNAVHVNENGKWLMASVREHASPSAAVRPKLGDLAWLIGDWTTDQESKKAELTFKWIVDKKFIELAYKVQDKKGTPRSGVQIIGQDPSSGEVVSWSFFANGGSGQGRWTPFQKGWIIDSSGSMPDGRPTVSTYQISRPDENTLGWKSVNRRIAGKKLKETEAVVLKRKAQ